MVTKLCPERHRRTTSTRSSSPRDVTPPLRRGLQIGERLAGAQAHEREVHRGPRRVPRDDLRQARGQRVHAADRRRALAERDLDALRGRVLTADPLATMSARLASMATAMQAPMPKRRPWRLPDPCALIVAPALDSLGRKTRAARNHLSAGSREASSRPSGPLSRQAQRQSAATTSLEHGGNGHGRPKPAELSGEARRGFVRCLDGRYGLPGKRTNGRVGRQFKPPDSASSAETPAPCRQPALGPE